MLLGSELLSFLKKIRFNEQEFVTSILISNIKYNYLGLQNNNPFYFFYNQLDNTITYYFTEFKNIKDNIDKFLFKLLIILLIKKLSNQNMDK